MHRDARLRLARSTSRPHRARDPRRRRLRRDAARHGHARRPGCASRSAACCCRRAFSSASRPQGTLPFDTEATIRDADSLLAVVRARPTVLAASPVLGGQLHFRMATSRSSPRARSASSRRCRATTSSSRDGSPSRPNEIVANDATLRADRAHARRHAARRGGLRSATAHAVGRAHARASSVACDSSTSRSTSAPSRSRSRRCAR